MKRWILAFLFVGSLHADALFNFNADTTPKMGPFTDTGTGTSLGVTATFPVNTTVMPVNATNVPDVPTADLAGNALFIPVGNTFIIFNQELTSAQITVGMENSNGYVNLAPLQNGVLTNTFTMGQEPGESNGASFGKVSVTATAFNEIEVISVRTGFFIDNLSVTPKPMVTPEPSSLALLPFLFGLGYWRIRRK